MDITDPTEAMLQVYRAEGQDLQLKRNIKNYFVYGGKPSNNQVKKDQSCDQQKKAGKDYPKAPGLPGPGQEKLIRYPVFSYPLLSGLTGHNYLHINTDGSG